MNSIHAPAAGVPLSCTYWPPLAPASDVTWLPVADAVRARTSASNGRTVPAASAPDDDSMATSGPSSPQVAQSTSATKLTNTRPACVFIASLKAPNAAF